MEHGDLTPEQMEKVRVCKSTEDILALAKEEGYELSDDELDAVSGGADWYEYVDLAPECLRYR